jgi:hypothetical protein
MISKGKERTGFAGRSGNHDLCTKVQWRNVVPGTKVNREKPLKTVFTTNKRQQKQINNFEIKDIL